MLERQYPLLAVHSLVGLALVALAIAAIFATKARRWTLYALLVQVVLGVATWRTTGLRPPLAHWTLAILVGGVYAAATAAERRGRPPAVVRGLTIAAAVVVLGVYGIGSAAAHAGR